MPTATATYGSGKRRGAGAPSDAVARKIWLVLELLNHRFVTFEHYVDRFRRDKRSFQRDLQQLRGVCADSGIRFSRIEGNRVRLIAYDAPSRRVDGEPPLLLLIAEVARALGEPVRAELGAAVDRAPLGDPFLHVHLPQLAEGSHTAEVYELLRSAARAAEGRAWVRFRYLSAKGTEEREVDPHFVLVRSGRYYLVGWDRARRAWRNFALDAIVDLPVRVGTVREKREVSEAYLSDDTLGFIKTSSPAIPVAIRFSPLVAAAARSRRWQRAQSVTLSVDGSVTIVFRVTDADEAIRWAFGWGGEAAIVSPPDVVARAQALAERLVTEHEPATAALLASDTSLRQTGAAP